MGIRKKERFTGIGIIILISLFGCSISKEPGMLRRSVRMGQLPPLSDRLPENPLVIEPYESPGVYGGTITSGWLGINDKWGASKYSEEYMIMLRRDGKGLRENLADSWLIGDNHKSFTFHIRENLRWSDGELFTTDDIYFFWTIILEGPYQEYLNRAVWLIQEEKAHLYIIDKYTFSIKFPEPQPNFLNTMATEVKEIFLPKHCYMKLLPLFLDDEALSAVMKRFGFSDRDSYLEWIINFGFLFPDIPTLRPWIASTYPSESIFIMSRNPFYWKTDTQGKQLPYIDELRFLYCPNRDVINNLLVQEFTNFQFRHLYSKSWAQENVNTQKYNLFPMRAHSSFYLTLAPNMATADPLLRKLFRDEAFRRALSHGIDRSEFGQGIPVQASLPPDSPFYSESWEQKAIEYDPEKSIEIIKSLGIPFREGRFYRPDTGEPLHIYLDMTTTYNDHIDFENQIQKIIKSLNRIGIMGEIRQQSSLSMINAMKDDSLEIELQNFVPANFSIDPTCLIPFRTKLGQFGSMGTYYQTGGQSGTEPIEPVARLVSLYLSLEGTDEDEKKIREIYRLYEENLWIIGTNPSSDMIWTLAADKSIRNIEPGLSVSDSLRTPGNLRIYQLWIDN